MSTHILAALSMVAGLGMFALGASMLLEIIRSRAGRLTVSQPGERQSADSPAAQQSMQNHIERRSCWHLERQVESEGNVKPAGRFDGREGERLITYVPEGRSRVALDELPDVLSSEFASHRGRRVHRTAERAIDRTGLVVEAFSDVAYPAGGLAAYEKRDHRDRGSSDCADGAEPSRYDDAPEVGGLHNCTISGVAT